MAMVSQFWFTIFPSVWFPRCHYGWLMACSMCPYHFLRYNFNISVSQYKCFIPFFKQFKCHSLTTSLLKNDHSAPKQKITKVPYVSRPKFLSVQESCHSLPFLCSCQHRQGPDGPPQAVKATMKKFDSRGKLRLYPDEMKASRQGVYWCLLEMREICNTRNVCVYNDM